ncbi:MAG: hypothetical protein NVS2B14_22180 [Chamaesiphon sp.]
MSDFENLYTSIIERFGINPTPPLPLGTKLYNPKTMCESLIVGEYWDVSDKDWRYLVVDAAWNTPPLWICNRELFKYLQP